VVADVDFARGEHAGGLVGAGETVCGGAGGGGFAGLGEELEGAGGGDGGGEVGWVR
jgi:hypothetical protein